MPSRPSRTLAVLPLAALLALGACDSVGPADPGPMEPEPTAPEPTSPSSVAFLDVEFAAATSAVPCHIDGGGVDFETALAVDEAGGLVVAATHDDSIECDGGPGPIWTLDPSGGVASRADHPFGTGTRLVGGRGGFVAVDDVGGALRTSWMLPSGEVTSTRHVANGLDVRAVHAVRDPASPRGLAAVWVEYAAPAYTLVAITAGGETLWSLPWDAAQKTDLVVPDGDGAAIALRADRLVRVDASGTVTWDRSYASESWEAIDVGAIVRKPEGGYWAVARLYGGTFSHLLVLDLDADGQELGRRTFLTEDEVDEVILARELGGALAVLLSVTEESPNRTLRPYPRSVRIDGDAIVAHDVTPREPWYIDNGLIDLGDGRFVQSWTVRAYGCMGGCFGNLGVMVQPVEVTTVLRTL